MSGSKEITVTRDYQPEPKVCTRALVFLLKTPVHKEGSPTTAPTDDVKESNGYVAIQHHNR